MRYLILASLLAASAPAAAHDTWLALAPASEQGVASATVLLTTGDAFPALGEGSLPERLVRADAVLEQGRAGLRVGRPRADGLPLHAPTGAAALVVFVASLHARKLELAPAAVETYLDEIGGDPAVARRHTQRGRWRERYAKHAKALLRRAPGPASALATTPQGLAYELVPSTDPTALPVGSAFEVCAFALGRPAGRSYVGLVESDGTPSWQWSDERGCVEVRPRSPQGYLLRSVRLLPTDVIDLDWDSHFAALTVYRTLDLGGN